MQISLEVIGLCLDQLDQDFQHLLKYHGFVDLQDTGDLSKVCQLTLGDGKLSSAPEVDIVFDGFFVVLVEVEVSIRLMSNEVRRERLYKRVAHQRFQNDLFVVQLAEFRCNR